MNEKDRLLLIVLILLLLIGIGFFFPVSANRWLGFFIKVVIFVAVFFILYGLLFSQKWNQFLDKSPAGEDQEDVEDVLSEKTTWEGFGDAFKWFYQEFISIVRNGMVASAAGFYLNKGGSGYQLQTGEDDQGRIDLHFNAEEKSLVNLVGQDKKPIIEDKLRQGTHLSGIERTEICSFLGVPLLLDDHSVGVLALGSHAESNFSVEDIHLLVRYGNLLTQVMTVYHRGLRYEMDHEIFYVHLELLKLMKNVKNEEELCNVFVESIKKLFAFDRFTFCLKEGTDGLIQYVYGQINEFDRGVQFPIDDGLNGWILKRNKPLLIGDIAEGDYQRPRYFKDEGKKHGLRSFLGIPLSKGEEVFGSLSLESQHPNQYGERTKTVFKELAEHFEMSRERILLKKQMTLLTKGRDDSMSPNIQID